PCGTSVALVAAAPSAGSSWRRPSPRYVGTPTGSPNTGRSRRRSTTCSPSSRGGPDGRRPEGRRGRPHAARQPADRLPDGLVWRASLGQRRPRQVPPSYPHPRVRRAAVPRVAGACRMTGPHTPPPPPGPGRELVTFRYDDNPIRTVLVDGEAWVVAADVCAALGIANGRDAVSRLDPSEKGVGETDTRGGRQRVTVISEPGLYRLVMRSNKPDAVRFQMWIAHEVLPAIRKTGRYEAQPAYRLPQSYSEALRELADQVERTEQLRAEVEQLAPRAHSWDVLASGYGDYSVRDAAKILSRDPAIDVGERRLFGLLAEQGWIYRQRGDGRWRAYQQYIERGWLSVLPSSHYHPRTGELVLDPPQVRITVRGIHQLHRLLGGTAPLQIEPAAEQQALPIADR